MISFNIFSHLRFGLRSDLFPWGFLTKILKAFLISPTYYMKWKYCSILWRDCSDRVMMSVSCLINLLRLMYWKYSYFLNVVLDMHSSKSDTQRQWS